MAVTRPAQAVGDRYLARRKIADDRRYEIGTDLSRPLIPQRVGNFRQAIQATKTDADEAPSTLPLLVAEL